MYKLLRHTLSDPAFHGVINLYFLRWPTSRILHIFFLMNLYDISMNVYIESWGKFFLQLSLRSPMGRLTFKREFARNCFFFPSASVILRKRIPLWKWPRSLSDFLNCIKANWKVSKRDRASLYWLKEGSKGNSLWGNSWKKQDNEEGHGLRFQSKQLKG